ncbi:hypothetical protein [Novosphingobium colocasiae]|uniref:Uncharacterized protein n=2 Tax=Bacteria TaxID=2 RepID=A0A918PH34_9SPHN|nr:hypothetical protein [Novosphingobium colocasiae]GGZ09324.1 hypothetical protein GCM10011614_25200 [Novosphingobium colocasiae]
MDDRPKSPRGLGVSPDVAANASSAGADYRAGRNMPQDRNLPTRKAARAAGSIGARPVRWRWWFVGLCLSLAMWAGIAALLGVL